MRCSWKSTARGLSTAGVVLGLLGGVPSIAAAKTCNGLLTIDYVAGPNFPRPGDVVRVRLTLGTGSIQGGTKLTVNRLTYALDDHASHMDVDQFALSSMSEDHKEGVAAFRERRKPKFRGR